TPELKEQDGRPEDSLAARIRALEDIHDAIGMGVALDAVSGDPEERLVKEGRLAALEAARKQLSAERQRIAELHYFQRTPLEDVGRVLQVGRTTIIARHGALLVQLRALLEGWK